MKSRTIFSLFLLLVPLCCANERTGNNNLAVSIVKVKQQPQCDEQIARIIGKLYNISNPLYMINNWEELETFVIENRSILLPNNQVIRCMLTAGERMQVSALQSFDPNSGDQAYNSAINLGATAEMANQIKSNVDQGQVQLFALGQELVWLSQVIPKAAQGDWSDFLNTGTLSRKQTIEYLNIMIPMFEMMGEAELLSYLMTTMSSYQPYIEYQTAIMVSWFFE